MLDKTRKQKKSYVLLIICKRKTLKKQKKNQDVKLISPLCFYCLEKSKKECFKKCFKQGKKVKNK